jgi:hypothetical protein
MLNGTTDPQHARCDMGKNITTDAAGLRLHGGPTPRLAAFLRRKMSLLAHRVISVPCSNSVAFGLKRTYADSA